ncbi:MAG: T9SS type A sorting domain-containing protein [Bacteroidota bacterium]|nr:T9SS type A sorting domain-containing protein [Bacteroidota bacterium]
MNLIIKQLLISLILLLLLSVKSNAQCSPPVYFAMMLHIEDNWHDDTDSMIFVIHANQLRNAVGFVKPWGAKFTAECSIPFALGCTNWSDNVLQSLIDSTMGVGSHSNQSTHFNFTKTLVDNLVGSSNNRGISGGTGLLDSANVNNWVDSATLAGFSYKDGLVYSAYLQIPQNERPDSVSDAEIANGLSHNPAPEDFYTRIHPHRVSSASTWHTDTTGPIMLLTGSLGGIAGVGDSTDCFSSGCTFDFADVDSIKAHIIRAIINAQNTGEFTVIYVFTQLNTYTLANKPMYNYLFQSLAPFIASGNLEYKTMGEIYDEFVNCETITNINNKTINDDLVKIFPNPCSNQFNIELNNQNDKINSIEIINLLGQTIHKKAYSDESWKSLITIDFPQQHKGVFVVKVNTKENLIIKKVLLQ